MSQNININLRLILAFSLTTMLAIILSLGSFQSINVLSDAARNMHRHPLAVSNAVLRANVNILAIHRSMKDVILAKNETEITAAVSQIEQKEKEVLQNLKIVQERFLGDQNQVTRAIWTIQDARPIRLEVISLARTGQVEAAEALLRSKGMDQLTLIEHEMQQLNLFASNKAEEFRLSAEEEVSEVLLHMSVLLLSIIVINIGIAIVVIRRTKKQVDKYNEAGDELRASEKRYRELYENSPLGYQSLDAEGCFVECNEALCWMLGCEKNEIIGTYVGDFLTEESAEKFKHRFPRFKAKGRIHATPFDMVTKDGRVISVEIDGSIGYDEQGSFKQTHCVIQDVTERKQIKQALQVSEERLRAIVDSAIESIITCDSRGIIVGWNQGAQISFGYSVDEIIGHPVTSLMSEQFRKDHQQGLERVVSGGESHVMGNVVELIALRKDGSFFPIELSIATWPSGGETFFTAILRDITVQKQAEEELSKHRHHLETLVEERTSQLAEAQGKAEIANQAKSNFLANMSHEIRTPMNAIIGLTHLLGQTDLTSGQLERLNKIDLSGKHLLSVINNILDISKIEAGKLTLEQSDFDLNNLFDDVRAVYQEQIDSKGLTFETDISNVPRWLLGDPTRLRQALFNYVGNAVKFTEHGSISLRATKLDENGSGILIRFEVVDSGIGVAPDNLSALFESFEQADQSTTRKHGGTGLGLAINRRLSELMGGEAGAESEPGSGSTFWFTARLGHAQGVMPHASSKSVENAEKVLPDRYKGCRILLAEDNAINSEVAEAVLSAAELVVETVENGREAVDKVRDNDYDLVLMDIQMPEMDGFEATRLIRAMKGKENLPILAMTANVFTDDREKCLETGMNDFVAKPFEVSDLFNKLARWLPRQEA